MAGAPTTILIAEDTEFVTCAPNARGQATNKVLCYSFAALSPDNPELRVSGLIEPEHKTRGGRYTSAALLSRVLTACERAGVGVDPSTGKLATDLEIIHIFHFSRADLPGHADISKLKRIGSIRGTFASSGRSVLRDIRLMDGRKRSITYRLVDTLLLSPDGLNSLESIGDALQFDKLDPGVVIDGNGAEVPAIEHMDLLFEQDPERANAYARRDAEITVLAAYGVIYGVVKGAAGLLDSNPPTLGSAAVDLLIDVANVELGGDACPIRRAAHAYETARRQPSKERKDRQDAIREMPALTGEAALGMVIGKVTSKTGKLRPEWLPGADRVAQIAADCFHGGRNGAEVLGQWSSAADYNGRVIRDIDLSGAYTTAMCLLAIPDWAAAHSTTDLEVLRDITRGLSYALVRFWVPETVAFPCLPIDGGDSGLLYLHEGVSAATWCEIDLALRMGARLEVVEGWHIPWLEEKPWGVKADPDADGNEQGMQRPFVAFALRVNELRAQFAKGTFYELTVKTIGNSAYGKIAQNCAAMKSNPRSIRMFDAKVGAYTDMRASKITSPALAATISGFPRATLSEIAHNISVNAPDAEIMSMTTDGMLCTASCAEANDACHGPLGELFSDCRTRVDAAGAPYVIEQKHAALEVVVFKTRGAWTVVPALNITEGEHDRLKPEKAGKMSKMICARAGHKLPTRVDDPILQNEAWLRVYKGRRAGQIITQRVFVPLAEQWAEGHDIHKREHVSAISMCWDMKRELVDVCDGKNGLIKARTKAFKDLAAYDDAAFALTSWRRQARAAAKLKSPDGRGIDIDQDSDAPLPPPGVTTPGVLLRAVDYDAYRAWGEMDEESRLRRWAGGDWTPLQRSIVLAWCQGLPGFPKKTVGRRPIEEEASAAEPDAPPDLTRNQIADVVQAAGLEGATWRVIKNLSARAHDPRHVPVFAQPGDAEFVARIARHLSRDWPETMAAMVASPGFVEGVTAKTRDEDSPENMPGNDAENAPSEGVRQGCDKCPFISQNESAHLEDQNSSFQKEAEETNTYLSVKMDEKIGSFRHRGERCHEPIYLATTSAAPEHAPLTAGDDAPAATQTQITMADWRRLDELLRERHGVGPVSIALRLKQTRKLLTGEAAQGAARIGALIKARDWSPQEAADEFSRLAMEAGVTAGGQSDEDGQHE